MIRISVASNKGGVAKTTSTSNLACALAEKGRSVLVIDMDPQGHLSEQFDVVDLDQLPATIGEVLVGTATIAEATVDVGRGVHVVPARPELDGVERQLVAQSYREVRLKSALDAAPYYDYVLVDTRPTCNDLTVNALCAAPKVIVPLVAGSNMAYKGALETIQRLAELRGAGGIKFEVLGVLRTLVHKRRVAQSVVEEALSALGPVFETVIPNRQMVVDSELIHGEGPLFWQKPDSDVAYAFRALADEVINRCEKFELSAADKQQAHERVEA